MPFKSTAQQGWMFENKPAMAKQWAADTPDMKALPARVDKDEVRKAVKRRLVAHGPKGGAC